LIRFEVKQLATGSMALLSIFACVPQADTPSSTTTPESRCEAVSRPARSAFVRVAPDGTVTRWPILRPTCARVGARADAVVIVDDEGVLFSVGGQELRFPSSTAGDAKCLGRVRTVRDGFVVVGDDGAWRFTAAGRLLQPLPTGIPPERVSGFAGPLFLVRQEHDDVRYVDVTGAIARPLFTAATDPLEAPSVASLDGDPAGAVPPNVIAASVNGEARLWMQRSTTDACNPRHTVHLPGRSVVVDDPVVLLRDRVLVLRGDRVDELRADGADRSRFIAQTDADAAGRPLGDDVRERIGFTADSRSGAVLVSERVRSPDCSIDDRLTVVEDDGRVRRLALPPAMRTSPAIVDGAVFFAESEVTYEALKDPSGTSLP
jgi:hypothetical protein